MPIRVKNDQRSHIDGYTKDGDTVYPHGKNLVGVTQSIDSAIPKGQRIVLLEEPITRSFYPPLNAVEFRKTTVTATPHHQYFWLYADGRLFEYYDGAGISSHIWIRGLQAFTPSQPTQAMKDLALAMAMSRVGDSPFSGAVDLGELDETMRFMKKPFADLGELFTRFHRKVDRRIGTKLHPVTAPSRAGKKVVRNGVRASMEERKRISEIVANTWLEGRYAAGPLIYSACGLAETAATSVTNLVQQVHSARGANKYVQTYAYDINPDWLLDGVMNYRRGLKVNSTETIVACYVFRYIYYPWMIDAINLARYGISPTQLGSTLYELTPLSFVGDWFVNFGTWLKAMEPKPQCRVLDACYSHKYVVDMFIRDNGGAYSYYSRLPVDPDASATFKLEYLKRDIVTHTLTAPSPRLKGKMLSIAQSVDAITLLSRPIQKFFGRFAKFI